MAIRLSVVCENSVGRPIAALGEHGFSCLIETQNGCWLFDAGNGSTLLHNLQVLGHDPHRIDGVILSHGHRDHTGGLKPLLAHIGPRPVYLHAGAFRRRFWQGVHERREIGLPWQRAALETLGAKLVLVDGLSEVSPQLTVSGPLPRKHSQEAGDPHLVVEDAVAGEYCPDPFDDDMALAITTSRGLAIVFGCAHAGLMNTVDFLREAFAGQPIHMLIGGTHLGPASDEQFAATLDYLDRLPFDRLGLSHCTGQMRAAELYARYPNKVFFASVGTSLEFP